MRWGCTAGLSQRGTQCHHLIATWSWTWSCPYLGTGMGRQDRQLAPSRELGYSRAQAGAGDKQGGWPLAWSSGTAAPGTPWFQER